MTWPLFLHEWRRCVCRLCTSHHSRVASELQIRLRHKRKTNRAPNKLDDEWPESIFHHVGNQSRQFSSSSSPDTPRTKVVLQSQINGISSAGGSLGTPTFRLQLASHKQALRDHMGYSQETADPSNKARRTEAGSSSTAAGSSWHSKPPPRLRPQGGPTGGGSSVVLIRSLPTQQQPPCRATSAMRWVTLVTFSIGA